MPTALITGASRGLGREIALALATRGWHLVVDGRTSQLLQHVSAELAAAGAGGVVAVPGDVADVEHRQQLLAAVPEGDGLDLLVNNASLLGSSPLPPLADYPLDILEQVYAVNVLAPLALTQLLLPRLTAAHGRLINISSDAAVEPYEGWGGYGSSKAALDQWTAVLAAEQSELRAYALDPGDMRTAMHQAAYPGEDISDRPEPVAVVPAVLRLINGDLPSGRYQAASLLEDEATVGPAGEVA